MEERWAAWRRAKPSKTPRARKLPPMSRSRPLAQPPPLPRPLLTADAVAELLAVTRSAIYARHARGAIPGGVRFGRTLRFDPDIIAAWIAAHTDRGGAP